MSKNNYLAQRDADRQRFFVAGCETATQQFIDMMCIALHDPKVMGKDTFGKERIRKLYKAIYDYEAKFHDAWMNTEESDWLQEQMDGLLQEIFGDELEPFSKRYKYTREWNYNKPSRR